MMPPKPIIICVKCKKKFKTERGYTKHECRILLPHLTYKGSLDEYFSEERSRLINENVGVDVR